MLVSLYLTIWWSLECLQCSQFSQNLLSLSCTDLAPETFCYNTVVTITKWPCTQLLCDVCYLSAMYNIGNIGMAGTGAQASSTLALPLQQQLAGQATYSGIFNANQGTSFGQQRQQPPPWWFKGSWSIGCILKYVDIAPVEKVFVFRHFSFFDVYFCCILNLAILSSKQCYITALLVYHCGHLHERIMHDLFLLFPLELCRHSNKRQG